MAPARKRQRLENPKSTEANPAGTGQASSGSQEQADSRRSLFVRALPATTTSESLTDLFSEAYPIKHATAVIDPETKQCRGYGFVTFADAEDAERAREEFNGRLVEGRKLRIELAEPRNRDTEKNADAGPAEVSDKRAVDKRPPQQSRLIVRNLPWTIKTPESLSKLFLPYGKVKQAYLPKKPSGELAGFGFVILRGQKNAETALEGVNGKEVEGRTLAVDWAVQKELYSQALATANSRVEPMNGGSVEALHNDHIQNTSDHSQTEISLEGSVIGSDEHSGGVGLHKEEEEDEDQQDEMPARSQDVSTTLFIRNLPFECGDEDLDDHFAQFGSVRYARVVMDPTTERSRGTGFVCFYSRTDAEACLRQAPRREALFESASSKTKYGAQPPTSILQNEAADASGQYTLNGRVLEISKAVDKSEAIRLTEEGVSRRHKSDQDKRRLFLLSEGTISSKSSLWEKLSPSERTMREASARQRKQLIDSNPSLHLSLTRLSVRNIPRSITSKQLKALAREAVVGFAADVKNGSRAKLSKEELSRGGDEMRAAEVARKQSGKGLVKQAKVVFEGASGSKVAEDSGAGRSRGYGFIEYHTHRNALMGLRYLNGHAVGYQVKENSSNRRRAEDIQDKKKRLIVEFAIENAQVVKRRNDSEAKARDKSRAAGSANAETEVGHDGHTFSTEPRKRKRGVEKSPKSRDKNASTDNGPEMDEKTKQQNHMIGKKRAIRMRRKGGG